jgi:hypothetical protein
MSLLIWVLDHAWCTGAVIGGIRHEADDYRNARGMGDDANLLIFSYFTPENINGIPYSAYEINPTIYFKIIAVILRLSLSSLTPHNSKVFS